MEEQQVSLGLEAGGYFTAGKGYSLKVVVDNGTILFSVSGEKMAKTEIPVSLLIPVVGALDFIGTGIVNKKEVIGKLYIEKGADFGKARIRVKKEDGDKVFTEVPAFEAAAIASYILNTVKLPGVIRYGIMNFNLEISEIFGERKIALRAYSPDGERAVVFDYVGFSKMLSAIRNACLGGLYVPIKISGIKGYVVVQEFIETEEAGKEGEVKALVQEINKAARAKNIPPLPLIREALKKKGIPYKQSVRLRIGRGEEGENRIEIRIPPAHAWGIARVGEKLIKS